MQTGLVYLRNAASLLTSRCSRSKRIVDFNMFRVAVAFSVIFLYFSCASLHTTHSAGIHECAVVEIRSYFDIILYLSASSP